MNSYISAMKKQNHNIYGLNNFAYKLAIYYVIALWILLFFDINIRRFPALTQAAVWIFALAAPIIVIISAKIREKTRNYKIIPYSRQDDFEFLGLYNLKDSSIENKKDILTRDEEMQYMRQVLEETIFPQISVKQALCITGPSGCGKSIILNFFKQTYKDEYKIFDLSGNYHEFDSHMLKALGTNIDKSLSEITSSGKAVFILDQFERFFFLPTQEQMRIHEIIKYLCRKNTAIIISLREEYLSSFLKRFDMNNLLSDSGNSDNQDVIPRGILRKMFSVITNSSALAAHTLQILRPAKTSLWEDQLIKNNSSVHLDSHEAGSDRVIMEKMGSTLLYCQNQNDISFQLNGVKLKASIIESKCRNLFGESGSKLFQKHSGEPLIEQQIIFHMAEFNKKILSYSDDELRTFMDKNDSELLDRYFDCQLASCGNYFHASRLLYLLSQARMRQISLKTQDLENFLFPDLFNENGHAQMQNIISRLENIQLIRKNAESRSEEYEIAHDFIASSYLNYCSTNMNRNVKNALDLFISENMDERLHASFQEKIEHRKAVYKQHFYGYTAFVTIIFMLLTYFAQKFIFNPWTDLWSSLNPYGSYFPTFSLFISVLSVIYIYSMFNSTLKYYRGEKFRSFKIFYILFMILAEAAVFAYPHFLSFNGLYLTIASMLLAFLLDARYRQTCRNELIAYASKSFMVSVVIACVHVFYCFANPKFDDFLIISEFIMFTILIGYGFVTHLTQEFLFARMADTSSEKII